MARQEGKEVDDLDEMEQLKSDLRLAVSNLRTLSKGVRLIASQIVTKHRQNQTNCAARKSTRKNVDNSTNVAAEETGLSDEGFATSDSSNLPASEELDQKRETGRRSSTFLEHSKVADLLAADGLAAGPAADLLALQNASEMILEHMRLASEEASLAVEDSIRAQASSRRWQQHAYAAQSELNRATAEINGLRAQNKKLTAERKVLVKEVRKVRKELADKHQETMWSQLESYVTSALNIHEHQLKSAYLTPKHSQDEEKEDGDGEGMENSSSESKSSRTASTDALSPKEPHSQNQGKLQLRDGNQHQINDAAGRSIPPRLSSFAGGVVMSFGFMPYSNNIQHKSKEQLRSDTVVEVPGEKEDPKIIQQVGTVDTTDSTLATPPQSPGRSDSSDLGDDDADIDSKLVSVERRESKMSVRLESPITFLESPPGTEPAIYGEVLSICDPHILRSLALPSEKDF